MNKYAVTDTNTMFTAKNQSLYPSDPPGTYHHAPMLTEMYLAGVNVSKCIVGILDVSQCEI